uniref:Uncharacterized protein n=1 Tax=Parascaris univalens TaxID=6257 RepID=A0A915AF94_PARUN
MGLMCGDSTTRMCSLVCGETCLDSIFTSRDYRQLPSIFISSHSCLCILAQILRWMQFIGFFKECMLTAACWLSVIWCLFVRILKCPDHLCSCEFLLVFPFPQWSKRLFEAQMRFFLVFCRSCVHFLRCRRKFF